MLFSRRSFGSRICLQCRKPRFSPWVGNIPWRREWEPTPVFLPGEPHGQRNLAGFSPWGHKESDTTERLLQCIKQEDSGAYSQILALSSVSCVSQKDSSSLCYTGSSPHMSLHYYTWKYNLSFPQILFCYFLNLITPKQDILNVIL